MSNNNTMTNYIQLRGDLSFFFHPFQEVDSMVLTQLSYLDFADYVPGADTVSHLSHIPYGQMPTLSLIAIQFEHNHPDRDEELEKTYQFLKLVGESKRYGSIRVGYYVNDVDFAKEKQFSAVTFFFHPFHAFVAFRGTDQHMVSWKENFGLTYAATIGAEEDAATYLQFIGKHFPLLLKVGGHSKGGALALYACRMVSNRLFHKITDVFLFDAPGTLEDPTLDPKVTRYASKIHAYVPEGSIVGQMMIPYTPQTVVKSNGHRIYQHSMATWLVSSNSFDYAPDRNGFSYQMSEQINQWIYGLPLENRKDNVNQFFDLLDSNGIKTFYEATHMDIKKLLGLLVKTTKMSKENRDLLGLIIKNLFF